MMIQAAVNKNAQNQLLFLKKLITAFVITFFFFAFTTFAQAKTYALGDIKDTSPITIDPPKYVPSSRNDDVIVGRTDVIIGVATFKSSSRSKLLSNNNFESESVITLPNEKDWSDVVTPVKNQGGCGSCVIFSTTGALESFLLRKNKKTFDISEQYGLSCHMPANLCNKGTMISSYLSPLKTMGTSEELSQYPYTASFGSCSSAGKFLTAYNFAFKVNSYEKVGIKTADDLKATLVKYGPVVGAMNVHNSFMNYTSGIYKPNQIEQDLGGHAILIVGYSDTIGGFKVKNSWGTDWGDKGFFWISYDQVGGKSDFGTRGGGVFAITDASAPNVAPQYLISSHNVTPSSAKAGSSFTFTANLNMALPRDWKVKIDLGSGVLSQMTMFAGGGTTNYSLSRNLSNIGTYTYKIGIYDSRDILQGVVSSGIYKVESAAPVVTTTGYTKIANDGSILADSAKLGSGSKDWACTKDNKTGLIWEIKTTDGGLRDSTKTYTWDKGNDFATFVNSQSLCGSSDWRLPTNEEFKGLVYCSDGKMKTLGKDEYGSICTGLPTKPTINTTYFPNTQSNWFWSSSSYAYYSYYAWYVYFDSGYSGYLNKNDYGYVRLVRNSSNSPIVNPTPVIVPTVTNFAPTLKLISNSPDAVISPMANYNVGVSYNIMVQANDVDGNLISVDINWGDSTKESKAASNGSQIALSHTYTTAGNYTWSVIASDSKGSSSSSISKTLKVENKSVPVVVNPPVSNSGYTKIANNGSTLSDSAQLGSAPTDWACTKDNKTGLIWEVKTDDGGLRDKDWIYTWYKPEGDNGGSAGYTDRDSFFGTPNCSTKDNCNTYALTNAVNKQGLCGAKDWRMPTNEELKGLVFCSDGKTKALGKNEDGFICASNTWDSIKTTQPTINNTYFPNTQDSLFWSSSPSANDSYFAWLVGFSNGFSYGDFKSGNNNVRLVRG